MVLLFSAVVLSFVLLGSVAEEKQERLVEEPGVGGQAASCPDVSANLFTKWTTGGCAGNGDAVIIDGLEPPAVYKEDTSPYDCAVNISDLVSAPGGQRGCVCDFTDDGTDYFPTKLEPQFSEGWSVEYRNHFKIVDNRVDGTKYVLHLCGTPAPTLEGALENATSVEIPIRTVAVLPTVIIPLIEYIGQRESIVVTANANIESNCMAKLAEEGSIEDLVSATGLTDYARLANITVDAVLCDSGAFGSCRSVPKNQVAVSVSLVDEKTLFGDVEWTEYVALFYNREMAAKNVVENIETRFRCEEEAVAEVIAAEGFVRPKVLWATWYHLPTPGWNLGICPGSWYCEIVKAAGGELIGVTDHDPTESGHAYGYLSNEEFLAGPAKDADVWLYSGTNFLEPDVYFTPAVMQDTNASKTVAQFSSFTDGRVFDIMGNGAYDWFESRQAEPDVLLMDLIDIIHPEIGLDHERVWLRRVAARVMPPAAPNDDENDGAWKIAVAVTVGAVVALGAAVGLVLMRRRRTAQNPFGALEDVRNGAAGGFKYGSLA